ncbi:hypothetical protein [Aquimixticola soesokkakensis]|uniref:hypothetical protein n=1 Tax=Aquimixticola soesokkakensis TaxID=1519096 RepID=UPI001177B0E9|nr:hypothetical protein [Aquimixticola soesokkakensis]
MKWNSKIRMPKQNNLYYAVLRWGNDHINSGVKFSAFNRFLDTEYGEDFVSTSRREELFLELFTPINKASLTSAYKIRERDNDGEFHLKIDAAFRFIELQELQEARDSSRSAMSIAIGAIAISIFLCVAQIVTSVILSSPTCC